MSTTEDTITDLIAEYLRKKGINATTQITEKIKGITRKPDIKIENDGIFLGEAEWESNKWEGFGQARDFSIASIAAGSLLISYPDTLKEKLTQTRILDIPIEKLLGDYRFTVAFLRKDQPTDIKILRLAEIPKWIDENIHFLRKPKADVDEVISVLRQTARYLTNELKGIDFPNLFRNVLGASPSEEERKKAAKDAAGYLLVNQITFYRVLSEYKDYPEIEIGKLKKPQDLNDYFSLVDDYSPVFSYSIASEFTSKSLPVLKTAINGIYALKPEHIDHDALGKVFHSLTPLSVRKAVAAYYTSNEAAKLLANLSIENTHAKIMDPACGSGTLLAASYERKRDLLKEEAFNELIHKQFLDEIIGIDIMPFAAHLSTINLALRAPIYATDYVNIGIKDSTRLSPGAVIKPLSKIFPEASTGQRLLEDFSNKTVEKEKTIESGSISMDARPGKEIKLPTVDVIIMNPPFTRQQTVAGFSPDYKKKLSHRFSSYKDYIQKSTKYCYYFILLADRFFKINENGRIAAVLPTTLLRGLYAESIRKFLLEKYSIKYIIVREDLSNFSEDTDLREMLLIADKPKEKGNEVSFVTIKKLDAKSYQLIKKARETIPRYDLTENEYFRLINIPQDDLDLKNFFRPISLQNFSLIKNWKDLSKSEKLTSLEELDIEISSRDDPEIGGSYQGMGLIASASRPQRGDKWIVKKINKETIQVEHNYTKDIIDIPLKNVMPGFRRMAYRTKINVSDLEEYVLVDKFHSTDTFLSLTDIKKADFDSWKRYIIDKTSNLCVAARFRITAPGTSVLSYYSERGRAWSRAATSSIKGLEDDDAKIVSVWLNSTFYVLQMLIERKETEGAWMEINKFILKKMKILNPLILSDSQKKKILKVFNEVSKVEFPALWKQLAMNAKKKYFSKEVFKQLSDDFEGLVEIIGKGFSPRKIIDETIIDILGIKDSKQEEMMIKLYSDLLRELSVLKNIS